MSKFKFFVLMVLLVLVLVPTGAMCGTELGIGAHYWMAMEDIELDDIDEDGLAYMVSLQFDTESLLKFEVDLEIFPEEMTGTDENLYAPQAFILLGSGLYAGLGAGIFYYDGDFADDPFYILRAGIDLELLPKLSLDLNANYHMSDIGDLDDVDEDVDTDTLTIGAAIRLEI